MIYAVGFLVGFPIILFLIAEPLRNLGRYTFADVAAYRLDGSPGAPHRRRQHAGDRAVLPDRAAGGRREADPAPVRPAITSWPSGIVGVLMIAYVAFGGMLATTWVQIIKAASCCSAAPP